MLNQHSLFRVVYVIESDVSARQKIGHRKTVVADELQEAIDKVIAHETSECPEISITISEVVREGIEVWS